MTSAATDRRLEQARQHAAAGRLARAETIFRQVLRAEPSCATAWMDWAALLHDSGRLQEACAAYERLTNLRPDLPEAHYNHGTLLAELGHDELAIVALTRAVELAPDGQEAHNNLGLLYRKRGDRERALESFQRASADTAMLAALVNLGTTLLELGRSDEAVSACERAVAAYPQSGAAYFHLGLAQEATGNAEAAIASFQEAVRLDPGVEQWRFHLAARTGQAPPAAAPAEYVAALFDRYAERFDEHLVERLGYQTPQRLTEAIVAAGASSGLNILDLGCGTGLAGVCLKPLARRLVGVDLSPQMIEEATKRDLYDELSVAEITDFLARQREDFDLVVAADVFVYVGDLAETIRLATLVLRPGGLLAFSTEAHDGEGYKLLPGRRFAHSLEYLQEVSRGHGLVEVSSTRTVLRRELGADVVGWLVVLRRAACEPEARW